MTQKHFKAIARILYDATENQTRDEIAYELARYFDGISDTFKLDLFLHASGVPCP